MIIAMKAEVGDRLPSISKEVTFDLMRLFSGWPAVRSIHTDEEIAKAKGLSGTIAEANMTYAYICEMLVCFFGENWFQGGKLATSFTKIVHPGDRVTANGVVVRKEPFDSGIRLALDVWCENQLGEKVAVGTASAVVR